MVDTTYGYTPGSGALAAIDRITGTDYPYYKIKWGASGTVNDASAANPFPVGIIGTPAVTLTSTTITGTVAAAQSGTWNIGSITTLPAITGTVTVNGVPTTALDRGGGAATAQTLRATIDTAQLGSLVASGVPVISGGYDWLWIAASQTNTALPSTVTGSYIEHLICIVNTPATSQVQIKDGSGTVREILPNAVAGGVGTYILPIGITSKLGAWQVSTAAGVTVIATFHV